VSYKYLNDIFLLNLFSKIQTNILHMLREKYENIISIIKWAVATYVEEKKNRPDLSV
jgi:hypothetical protein